MKFNERNLIVPSARGVLPESGLKGGWVIVLVFVIMVIAFGVVNKILNTSQKIERGIYVSLLQQTIDQCAPFVLDGGPDDHNRLMVALNLCSLFRSYNLIGTTAEGDSLIFRDSSIVWKVYIKPSTIVFAKQTTN